MSATDTDLFCQQTWRMLNDGGIWGVPRSGLMYRKDAADARLVLYARMPWECEMPMSEAQLREQQDHDHANIVEMFSAIGIAVVDETTLGS